MLMFGRRLHKPVSLHLLVTLLYLAVPLSANPQKLQFVTVHEETLRRYAVEVVNPSYPQRAVKRSAQGVAVIQLDVNEQGSVSRAEVLEAPDPLISEAVAAAVKKWKFKPPTIRGSAVPIRGKLTFYYMIKDGKGRVENPRQFRQS
ncbi:MAG TPA: energy transducer TonB [Pyrinomonadaceae bacterium]|jgi:TonB family protein|nr:energy transducer TonB [Pyrinomonadaceae bacterium]